MEISDLSDYDCAWAASPQITDMYAVRLMVGEMVAQAVDEHRTISCLGYIKDGKVVVATRDGRLPRKVCSYTHAFELLELCDFFAAGGCRKWIDLVGLRISPTTLLEKL